MDRSRFIKDLRKSEKPSYGTISLFYVLLPFARPLSSTRFDPLVGSGRLVTRDALIDDLDHLLIKKAKASLCFSSSILEPDLVKRPISLFAKLAPESDRP